MTRPFSLAALALARVFPDPWKGRLPQAQAEIGAVGSGMRP